MPGKGLDDGQLNEHIGIHTAPPVVGEQQYTAEQAIQLVNDVTLIDSRPWPREQHS